MCGRFALSVYQTDLAEELGLNELPADYRPRYNIAPSQPVIAVRSGDPGPQAVWLHWGLIPFWAKDPAIGNRLINARAETIAEKPAFRRAFERSRCLVVADAFYEWKRAGSRKVPMLIRLDSARPFTFAGIAERWRGPEGEEVESCAIVTTAASGFMRPIHDRMPVILPKAMWDVWLDPTNQNVDMLSGLLVPARDDLLTLHEVSTDVNNVRNKGVELIAAV
jgi:putative SOS response-associated peptidase YedK